MTRLPDALLFGIKEFHVEQQRRVRRDRAAGAAGAVSELRRDDERPLAADLHAREALIPALNHLAGAELELEWVVAIAGAVELLAVLVGFARVVQPAGVVHPHALPRRRRCARADLAVRDLQARDVFHTVPIW